MSRPNNLRIGIVGAAGRMGQRLMQLATAHDQVVVSAVLLHKRPISVPADLHPLVTSDCAEFVDASDVVIDFSAPAAIDALLPVCARKRVPYLVASTALSEKQQAAVQHHAESLPILVAANLSVGVAVLGEVVREAARRLPEFDIEIVEAHHRHKRDAPSGTALYLFEQARASRAELRAEAGRAGNQAARRDGDVGLHAVRGGDVAGEHHVLFLGEGERLELIHRSHDGHVFARGALRAARWLQQMPNGLYAMRDVLAGAP